MKKTKVDFKMHNIAPLLDKLNAIERGKDKDGKPCFKGIEGFRLFVNITELETFVQWPETLTKLERETVLRKAIVSFAEHTRSFTKETLLKAVKSEVGKLCGLPFKQFCVVAKIWLPEGMSIRSRTIGNTKIRFHKGRPKGYKIDRKAWKCESVIKQAVWPEEDIYRWATVELKARNHSHAQHEAMEAFSLLRGIWNLCVSSQSITITLGRKDWPLDTFPLYPFWSVHDPVDSSDDTEPSAFYDSGYKQEPKYQHFSKDSIVAFQQAEDRTRRLLGTLSPEFRDYIEGVIRDYVKALSVWTPEFRLVKLWQVLETLARIKRSQRHIEIVTRLAPMFNDKQNAEMYFEAFRVARNDTSHPGEDPAAAQELSENLALFTRAIIRYLLDIGKNFKSISDYEIFLGLPSAPDKLNRFIPMAQLAQKVKCHKPPS